MKMYSEKKINQILKNLYSTDFFEDVKIKSKKWSFKYKVKRISDSKSINH